MGTRHSLQGLGFATSRSSGGFEKRCFWLGARYDAKKLHACPDPTILGATYDVAQFVLQIKKASRQALLDEIETRGSPRQVMRAGCEAI